MRTNRNLRRARSLNQRGSTLQRRRRLGSVITRPTAPMSLRQEKILVASILGDIQNWVKDIRQRELSRGRVAKRNFPLSRRVSRRRVIAEDMDGAPIDLDDEVEVPMDDEGDDEGGESTEIGLVVEVSDAEGEPVVSVEVEDGEVIDVSASKVRKVRRSRRTSQSLHPSVRNRISARVKKAVRKQPSTAPNRPNNARLQRLAAMRQRLNSNRSRG